MDSLFIYGFIAGFLCGVVFLPGMRVVLEFIRKYWLILFALCLFVLFALKGPAIVKFICDLCNQVCQ